MYLENNQLSKAIAAFDQQNKENEVAETYYHYSKVYLKQNDATMEAEMLQKAKELYGVGRTMKNNYYHYIDQIFLSDINEALAKFE